MSRQSLHASVRAVVAIGEASSWSLARTAEEIRRRHGFSPLKCFRLASGATLTELADEIREVETEMGHATPKVTHARISQWENGKAVPSRRYLDALCRVFSTRPDVLGFGSDYGGDHGGGTLAAGHSTGRPRAAIGSGRPATAAPSLARGDDETGVPAVAVADRTRERLISLLQTTPLSESLVEWYEVRVRHHGSNYRVVSTPQLLSDIVTDLAALQDVLTYRQRLDHQRRLTRVVAQLSGLSAIVNIDLDRPDAASRWFQAGHVAADEAEDLPLKAWLLTREALSCLYFGSAEEAIRLAQYARRLVGATPCTAAAMAPVVEARVRARLRQKSVALELLKAAEPKVARLVPDEEPAAVFGFGERKYRFYQGNVFARVGHLNDALEVQKRALHLYGLEDPVDRSHILLDHALCLLYRREPDEASRVASSAIRDLRDGEGAGAPLAHAGELLRTAVTKYAGLTSVSSLRDAIATRRSALAIDGP